MNNPIKYRKVIIIQGYNTPYRNDLFNAINDFEDIELHLVYIGALSSDRKWDESLKRNFYEHQIKIGKVVHVNYETSISKIDNFDLIRVVYKINPDVIITHFGQISTKITLALQLILKFNLVSWTETTVITSKGFKALKKYHKPFENIFKSYVVPGTLAKEYLEYSGFKLNISNTFFAPNSVDEIFELAFEEVNNKYSPNRLIKFLFVGSFIELKGVSLLLEALEEISFSEANHKFEFHFVGDGPIPIPEKPNYYVHGFLSKSQVIVLYKECHILVLPSLWDCNPLVVIEACKCGLVLMLSDGVGNYPEMINGNGIVFERGKISSMVTAFEYLLECGHEKLKEMAIKSLKISEYITHKNSASAFRKAVNYKNGEINKSNLAAKILSYYSRYVFYKLKKIVNLNFLNPGKDI
jgi:glycosyltransferase involved in cell wall biosynthesis